MRGALILGTFFAILSLTIAGDFASDGARSEPVTKERICMDVDFRSDFNLGDALLRDCEVYQRKGPPSLPTIAGG